MSQVWAKCSTSINLAIIKYCKFSFLPFLYFYNLLFKGGKSDGDNILPLNDSISITLQSDEITTKCEVSLKPLLSGHCFIINEERGNNDKRILKMIESGKIKPDFVFWISLICLFSQPSRWLLPKAKKNLLF